MSYGQFAYLYDELMKDVPYSKWVDFLRDRMDRYHVKGQKVLDLACGTGEISIRLAEEGYRVTGVDLSDEMLSVASGKASGKNLDIPFFQQDMSKLEGLGRFHAAVIFCDSLNYLKEPEDVRAAFRSVHEHLEPEGIFMFDVHSIYKLEHIFYNAAFTHDEEDISYIWNSFEGAEPYSVDHELSFFVLDPSTGQYDRFDEHHYQRTYPEKTYLDWLEKLGFELLETIYDLDENKDAEEAERILFIARKK
ncbi:class I SAM-dependent DNA methyltransferase [Peribacillus sp. SCS-26]|uniref:class I SAM-dependent DNA methyltransferase n=1 Tax=Paraperibacillus marinus TaxID=3115295 RepID=UPI0039063179